MKSIYKIGLLLGGIFLSLCLPLQAQTTEDERQQLLELAEKWNRRYEQQRAEVEAYCKQNNIPIRSGDMEIVAIENGVPVYQAAVNDTAVQSLSAHNVKPGGIRNYNLTGDGIHLGMWDDRRARITHQEFGSRASQTDLTSGTITGHASHVAGTMIAAGVVDSVEGFANQATLDCYDWNNDMSEIATAAAASTPILVSNHSYGRITGWDQDRQGNWYWYGNASETVSWKFGAYTDRTLEWDSAAFMASNVLIVKAAGNDRDDVAPPNGTTYQLNGSGPNLTTFRQPDGVYDCIMEGSTAKNILTVGATDDVPNGISVFSFLGGTVDMTDFSGYGPTDDGRIKPDVVANGQSLTSCSGAADNAYWVASGTSMASPSVAGGAALLYEQWENRIGGRPRAATMKALLIHTADDILNPGPDYASGWGLVNIRKAADLIAKEDAFGCGHIFQKTLAHGSSYTHSITSDGTDPIKVTIVWHDPPMTNPNTGTLNPSGAIYLVNNLELRVNDGGTTYFPYRLNPANPTANATQGSNFRDNVEQVYIDNPSAGTYTITVSHTGVLASPQSYSLIITGNNADPQDVLISGLSTFGRRSYSARNTIRFNTLVEVLPPGELTAIAGDYIAFEPGVELVAGSEVTARIDEVACFVEPRLANPYTSVQNEWEEEAETEMEAIEAVENEVSELRALAMPNPFDDYSTLEYELPQDAEVSIIVRNAMGQIVANPIHKQAQTAGTHQLQIDGKELSAGIYYAILQVGEEKRTIKLIRM